MCQQFSKITATSCFNTALHPFPKHSPNLEPIGRRLHVELEVMASHKQINWLKCSRLYRKRLGASTAKCLTDTPSSKILCMAPGSSNLVQLSRPCCVSVPRKRDASFDINLASDPQTTSSSVDIKHNRKKHRLVYPNPTPTL